MAPEILQRQQVGFKSDLWSLGIIMFYMLYRRLPFYSSSSLLSLIKQWTDPAFEVNSFLCKTHATIEADIADFFRRVLVFDHTKRVSFKDLYKLPFIQKKISQFDYNESQVFYSNLDNTLALVN